MKKIATLMVLSTLLISSIFAADNGYDFKLKLEKGAKYTFQSSIDQSTSQVIMGATQTYIKNMIFEYGIEVLDASEDLCKIRFSFTRIYLYSYNDAEGSDEFDTRKKEGPVPEKYKQIDALIGESFVASMNAYGEVSAIEGQEALINNLIEKLKPEDEEAAREQLNASYSEDGLRNDVENVFANLPGKEVKVGESWEEEQEFTNRFPIIINTKYNLEKVSKKKATISVNATLKSDSEKTTEINDMEFSYNLSGEQSGKYILDPKTGLTIERKMHQEISGDMEIVSGVMAGQKIPVSFKTDVSGKFL